MTRPMRVEFENAVYHVTARGNERRDIDRDLPDRQRFLKTLEEAVERFGVVLHASCLLPSSTATVTAEASIESSSGSRAEPRKIVHSTGN